MEDTMDVEEDMRMEEDPAVSELPMSTDEDSNLLVGSPVTMKVVDDRMASDSPTQCPDVDIFEGARAGADGATEMEADSVSSNDVNNPSMPEVENLTSPTVPSSNSETGSKEVADGEDLAVESRENVNDPLQSSSTEQPTRTTSDNSADSTSNNPTGDEASGDAPRLCVATSWTPEVADQPGDKEDEQARKNNDNDKDGSCEQDPLLDSGSNSSKQASNEFTEGNAAADGNESDPFGASAMENQSRDNMSSSADQTLGSPENLTNIDRLSRVQEEGNGTTSLADELGAVGLPMTAPSAGDQNNQNTAENADNVPDHISVDSSVSGVEPDHVSLDSDSDADGSESQKREQSTNKEKTTDSVKSTNEDSSPASAPSEVAKTADVPSKNDLVFIVPNIGDNGGPTSVELVDSEDENQCSNRTAEKVTEPPKSSSVLTTLLSKPQEFEMITRDTPKLVGRSPPFPASSGLPNARSSDFYLSPDVSTLPSESNKSNQQSMKLQYSVKPLTLPILKHCLHCTLYQRCNWLVTVAGVDYFICTEKCFKAHRQQRNQMLGNGAPTLTNIIQTSDTSKIFRKCSFCSASIPKCQAGSLTWEVMEFCNEDCLSKYQTAFTANCCNCKILVTNCSMGKYSVRFGHEVKQFCSPNCLDTYKKGIKTCSFCQKNLQDSSEGFLATVGGKDQFRDFCSQDCLEKYDCICNNSAASYSIANCVVCDNVKVVQYEVIFVDKVAKLCTDVCLAAYKFVNNIEVGICGMCNKYYDKNSVAECITFDNDTPTTFCSKHCMNISVISKRKIVPCACCKAKKYNFDMIYRRGSSSDDPGMLICSVNCLSLHNVSSQMIPTAKLPCSHCKKVDVSSFHISMSDGTMRHFCCYECVIAFQKNFPTILPTPAVPVPAGAPKKAARPVEENAVNAVTSAVSGPTIHSVSSLKSAPPQPAPSVSTTNNANRVKHTTLKIPSSFSLKVNDMKNKWTQISICSVSKCVSCRPKKEDRDTQCEQELTNGEKSPTVCLSTESTSCAEEPSSAQKSPTIAVIPIPVPIYIPYPAPMYTLPSPVPIPVPVPFIVPLVVPSNVDALKDILARCSPNGELSASGSENRIPLEKSAVDEESSIQNHKGGCKRDRQDERSVDDPGPVKRARMHSKSPSPNDDPPPDELRLKYMLGLNAWKNFVKTWNEALESEGDTDKAPLKTQLLSMRPHELNSALSLFLRKARKANGEEYRPDLKFYLGLGIQYYMFENGRTEDIFHDAAFEEFSDNLDEEANKFLAGFEESLVSRVEEEHLWECMQLGAKSPQVLLLTLMYFITLHCNLWTVDEHMQLSFDSFKKESSNASSDELGHSVIKITLNSSTSDESTVKECKLMENKEDCTRCPVRFYEFYITKCPEVAIQRNDNFYLMPESLCHPESPIWYKSLALPLQIIKKMLNRVKIVKEICDSRHKAQERTVSSD